MIAAHTDAHRLIFHGGLAIDPRFNRIGDFFGRRRAFSRKEASHSHKRGWCDDPATASQSS